MAWFEGLACEPSASHFGVSLPATTLSQGDATFSFAAGVETSGGIAVTRRDVDVTVTSGSPDTITASVAVDFSAELTGAVSCTVHGKIRASLPAVPAASADVAQVVWSATLGSADCGDTFILDDDMLSGAPAAVIVGASPLAWPPATPDEAREAGRVGYVAALLGTLATRMGPLDSSTSATTASVRPALLQAAQLPRPSPSNAREGTLLGAPGVEAVDDATVFQASTSCTGQACSGMLTRSLRDQLLAAAVRGHGVCAEPVLVPAATAATLSVDVAVSPTTVVPRAMRAVTTALFRCDSASASTPGVGFVGVKVEVRHAADAATANARWPALEFFNATDAAVGLVKSVPLHPTGVVTGLLWDPATATHVTLVPADLFGAGRGGAALPDSDSDVAQRVPALLAAVATAMSAGSDIIDAPVAAALHSSPSAAAALVARCNAVYFTPTVLRCLQPVAGAEVRVYVSPDASEATFVVGIEGITASTPMLTPRVTSLADAKLRALASWLNNPYEPVGVSAAEHVSGTTDARFAAVATVALTGGAAPTASLVGEAQIGAMVTIDVEFFENWWLEPVAFASASILVDVLNGKAMVGGSKVLLGYRDDDLWTAGCGATWEDDVWCDGWDGDGWYLAQLFWFGNAEWNGGTAVVSQVKQAIVSVQEYTQMHPRVLSTDIETSVFDDGAGVTNTQLLQAVGKAVPSNPPCNGYWWGWWGWWCTVIPHVVEDLQEGMDALPSAPNSFSHKHVAYLGNRNHEFSVFGVTQSLRWTRVAGAGSWQHAVGMERLELPTVVTRGMRLYLSTIGTPKHLPADLWVTGASAAENFAVPVAYKMLAGGSGGRPPSPLPKPTATLVINQRISDGGSTPASPRSALEVSMSVNTKLAGVLQLSLNDVELQSLQIHPGVSQLTVTGVDGMGVPSRVVNSAFKGLVRAGATMLSGSFDAQFPPLSRSLGTAADMRQETDAMVKSMQVPWTTGHPVAVSGTLCPNTHTSLPKGTVEFVVNGVERTYCPVATTPMPNLETVVISFRNDLAACGMSQFVTPAVWTKAAATKETSGCGTIGLFATTPGLVFEFQATAKTGLAFGGQRWKQTWAPTFGTWGDLLGLMHTLAGTGDAQTPFETPAPVMVPQTDLVNVIDAALAPYYPARIPVVQFPFRIAIADNAPESGLHPVVRSVGDGAELQLPPSAHTDLNVSTVATGSLGVAFRVSPLGNGVNITFSTSFNTTFNMTSVQPSATSGQFAGCAHANSFDLNVTAQIRDVGGAFKNHMYHQHIVLTPGSSVADTAKQVMQQLATSETPELKRLISYRMYTGKTISGTRQFKFDVSRVRLHEGGGPGSPWIIPTGVYLSNVLTPCFRNNSYPRPQERPVVHDLRVNASAAVQARAGSSKGRVGVVSATTDAVAAAGAVHIAAKAAEGKHHMLPAIMSSLRSTPKFFELFTADVNVTGAVEAAEMDLALRCSMPVGNNKPGAKFHTNTTWAVRTVDDYDAMVAGLGYDIHIRPTVKEVERVFHNLTSLTPKTLCEGVGLLVKATHFAAAHPSALARLPFSGYSFGAIMTSTWVKSVESLAVSTCHGHEAVTFEQLCTLADQVFKTSVCHARVVTPTELVWTLDYSWNTTLKDMMRFDVADYFGNVPELPIGVQAEGSQALIATARAQVELVIDFTGAHKDVPHMTLRRSDLTFTATFDVHGDVRAWFGPMSIQFAKAVATLGKPTPVSLSVTLNEPMQPGDVDCGTHDVDASTSCRTLAPHAAAEVAALAHTTGSPAVHVRVEGSATFFAQLTVPNSPYCAVNVTVPSVEALFREGYHAAVSYDPNCNGGLGHALYEALLQHTLLHYLQNSERFVQQLEQGFNGLVADLFGPNGAVVELLVPLVDAFVQEEITKELNNVIGPAAANKLGQAAVQFVNEVLERQNVTSNATLLTEVAVDGVTFLLNEVLGPLLAKPIVPPPVATAPTKVWKLVLGRKYTRPLPPVGYALGTHGNAFFESKAQVVETVDFEYLLTVDIVYTQHHGIHLHFPSAPALVVSAGVKLDAKRSYLEGRIGVLGAVLRPSGGVNVSLSVNPPAKKGGRFTMEADVFAGLNGMLHAGFEHMFGVGDNLLKLPNFELRVGVDWDWHLHQQLMTPRMYFSNVTLCAGTIITKVLGSVLKEINKAGMLMEAIEKVAGPQGLLNSKVPASGFLLGHEGTVAEVLQELSQTLCHGSCEFKDVFKLIHVVDKLMSIISQLEALDKVVDSGPDGCGIGKVLHDFYLDMTEKHPAVHKTSGPDTGGSGAGSGTGSGARSLGADAKTPATSSKKKPGDWVYNGDLGSMGSFFHSTYHAAETGSWGISMPFLKDPLKAFLDLIMGVEFTVVEVTTPGAEVSITGTGWEFVIWAWPEVVLFVDWDAGLTLHPFELSLTSTGIMNAIKDGSAGQLLQSVQISTEMPDGSPRWMVTGQGTIEASLVVGIWIFAIEASVGVTLEAMAAIQNPSGKPYVTFGELLWQHHSQGDNGFTVEIRLVLLGDFGLSIIACIPIPWVGPWCWTIVGFETQVTIWSHTWGGPKIAPPATAGGAVDLSQMQPGDTAHPYDTHIAVHHASAPPTLPPRQEDYKGMTNFSYVNSFPASDDKTPRVFRSAYTPTSFHVPASTEAAPVAIDVDMGSYVYNPRTGVSDPSAPTHVGPDGIVTPGSLGVIPHGDCHTLTLGNVNNQSHTELAGGLCGPTYLGGGGNVSISGHPTQYPHPVTVVNSTNVLDVHALGTGFKFNGDQVTVDDSMVVNTPSRVGRTSITCHTHASCAFEAQSFERGDQEAHLHGMDGDDSFVIGPLSGFHGRVVAHGGRGWDNISTTHVAQPGTPMVVAASPNAVVEHVPQKHTRNVAYDGIEQRELSIVGAQATQTTTSLTQPLGGTNVLVNSIGNGGTNAHSLRMCEHGAFVRYQVTGGGHHSLKLGNANDLRLTACSVSVHADGHPEQTVSMNLAAAADTRSVVIRVSPGMVTVEDAATDATVLSVSHMGVHRLELNTGVGGVVLHHDGGEASDAAASTDARTEVLVNMSRPVIAGRRNVVNVTSATNAGLVTGHVDEVLFGQRHLVTGAPLDPFSRIHSTWLIAPTNEPAPAPQPASPATGVSGEGTPSDGKGSTGDTGSGTDGGSEAKTQITMTTAAGKGAPAMNVVVGPDHIDRYDASSATNDIVPPSLAAPLSTWLCGRVTAAGFPASACEGRHSVLYKGAHVRVHVATGDAADQLVLASPKADVLFNLTSGDDVVWMQSTTHPVVGAMGAQRDIIYAANLGAPATVDMGIDRAGDTVALYSRTPLHAAGKQIFESSDASQSLLTVQNFIPGSFDEVKHVSSSGSITGLVIPQLPAASSADASAAAQLVSTGPRPPRTPVGSPEIAGARQADGTTVYRIESCDGHLFRRLSLVGSGTHLVYLGDSSGSLAGLTGCSARIHGGNESVQVNLLQVNAAKDTRSLAVHVSRNTWRYWDRTSGGGMFEVSFIKTQRLVFHGGQRGVHLRLAAGTEDTEQAFHLPTPDADATTANYVTARGVAGYTLVSGDFREVQVGQASAGNSPLSPLRYLLAPLALVSTTSHSPPALNVPLLPGPLPAVKLVSGSGANAPSQYVAMTGYSVAMTGPDGTPLQPTLAVPASDWMCDQLTATGMPADACAGKTAMLYHGAMAFEYAFAQHAPNRLALADVGVPVRASFGDRADTVHATRCAMSHLRVDLGRGPNIVRVMEQPLLDAVIAVGDGAGTYGNEIRANTANCGMQLLHGTNIVPASEGATATASSASDTNLLPPPGLRLERTTTRDVVMMTAEHTTGGVCTSAGWAPAPASTSARALVATTAAGGGTWHVPAGASVAYTVHSGATYRIAECGAAATLDLTARQDDGSVAQDWVIILDAPLDSCVLQISGEDSTANGTFIAVLPPDSEVELFDDSFGRALIGKVLAKLSNVAHIRFDSNTTAADAPNVMMIHGVPWTADLVVTSPDESAPVQVSATDLAGSNALFVNVAMTVTPQLLGETDSSLAFVGPASDVQVPFSSTVATAARLKGGCLLWDGMPTLQGASVWLQSAMASTGVNHTLQVSMAACKVEFGADVGLATVTVPSLSVSDLEGFVTHLWAVSSTVAFQGTATVHMSTLAQDTFVTPGYKLSVRALSSATTPARVQAQVPWASTSSLAVNCSTWPHEAPPTDWQFVGSSPATGVTAAAWLAPSACKGLVQTLPSMPAVALAVDEPWTYTSPPEVNVTLLPADASAPTTASRNVHVSSGGFKSQSSQQQPVVVTWHAAGQPTDAAAPAAGAKVARVQLRVGLSGGLNSVIMSPTPTPPLLDAFVGDAALHVDATALDTPLSVVSALGVLRAAPMGANNPLLPDTQFVYSAMPSARVEGPSVGTSVVVDGGTPKTEAVFSFSPSQPVAATANGGAVNNTARILGASAYTLLTGYIHNVTMPAASTLQAPVAVVGTPGTPTPPSATWHTLVEVDGSAETLPQLLSLSPFMLETITMADHAVGRPAQQTPTAWMCAYLMKLQLPAETCAANASVVFGHDWVTMRVVTGPATDYIAYHDVQTATELVLGGGDDVVTGTDASAPLSVNLGTGADSAYHAGTLNAGVLALGDDNDVDRVTLVGGSSGVNVDGTSIGPFGPASSNVMALQQWLAADHVVLITGDSELGPSASARVVNMPVAAGHLYVRPASGVWYSLDAAATAANIVFDASLTTTKAPSPPSRDWGVWLKPATYPGCPVVTVTGSPTSQSNATLRVDLGDATSNVVVAVAGHAVVRDCSVTFTDVAQVDLRTLVSGLGMQVVEGGFGGADVATGPEPHTLTLDGAGLYGSAVLVNAATGLSALASARAVQAVMLGDSAAVTVTTTPAPATPCPTGGLGAADPVFEPPALLCAAPDAPVVAFHGGCLTTGSGSAPPLSPFLRARLAAAGVAQLNVPRGCRVFTKGVASVSVHATSLRAGNVLGSTRALSASVAEMVLNSTVQPWVTVDLAPTSVTLPGGPLLTVTSVSPTTRASVSLTAIDAVTAKVTASCPVPATALPSSAPPHWLVGASPEPTRAVWDMPSSCGGTLYVPPTASSSLDVAPSDPTALPAQLTQLSLDVTVAATPTAAATVRRAVSLSASGDTTGSAAAKGLHVHAVGAASAPAEVGAAAASETQTLSVTWPTSGQPAVRLAIADGVNNVTVAGSQPLPTLPALHLEGQYRLAVPTGHAVMPGLMTRVPAEQQIVSAPDAAVRHCLHGDQCTLSSWEQARDAGWQGCNTQDQQRRCMEHAVVQLMSPVRAFCADTGAEAGAPVAGVQLDTGEGIHPDLPSMIAPRDILFAVYGAAFLSMVVTLCCATEGQWVSYKREWEIAAAVAAEARGERGPLSTGADRVPTSWLGRAVERLLHPMFGAYLALVGVSSLLFVLRDHIELQGIATTAARLVRDLGTGLSCGVGAVAGSANDTTAMWTVAGACLGASFALALLQWVASGTAGGDSDQPPSRLARCRARWACGRVDPGTASAIRRTAGIVGLAIVTPFVSSHVSSGSLPSVFCVAGVVALAAVVCDDAPTVLALVLSTVAMGTASRLDLQSEDRSPLVPTITVATVVVAHAVAVAWRLCCWHAACATPPPNDGGCGLRTAARVAGWLGLVVQTSAALCLLGGIAFHVDVLVRPFLVWTWLGCALVAQWPLWLVHTAHDSADAAGRRRVAGQSGLCGCCCGRGKVVGGRGSGATVQYQPVAQQLAPTRPRR